MEKIRISFPILTGMLLGDLAHRPVFPAFQRNRQQRLGRCGVLGAWLLLHQMPSQLGRAQLSAPAKPCRHLHVLQAPADDTEGLWPSQHPRLLEIRKRCGSNPVKCACEGGSPALTQPSHYNRRFCAWGTTDCSCSRQCKSRQAEEPPCKGLISSF